MLKLVVLLLALFSSGHSVEIEVSKINLNINDTVYYTKNLIPCVVIEKHSYTNVFEHTTLTTFDLERIRPKTMFKKRNLYDLFLDVHDDEIYVKIK
jgi:hypothetical protein